MAKKALQPLKKEYTVEKRNVLNEIRAGGTTLQEWRFFSIYLAKINHRDPKSRVVRFSLENFRRIMELGRLNIDHFKQTTDRLLTKVMHLPLESGGYTSFQFFKECTVDRTDDGEWYIEIDAHDKALPLFFEYKSHYFKYQLWNALRLKSANQLRMYEILKQYEKKGERILSIEALRSLLGIFPDEYPRWNNFKVRVLDSCQQALTETTDIKFSYEPHGKRGKGGKILALRFIIEKNENYIDQLTLDEFIELQDYEEISEEERKEAQYDTHLREYAGACDYAFTNEEMQLIAKTAVDYGSTHEKRVAFVREQYLKLKIAENRRKINNRFEYLLKIIKNEVDEQ